MRYLIIFTLCLAIVSCKQEKEQESTVEVEAVEQGYQSFGKEIMAADALSAERMAEHYSNMKMGDSVNSKMIATVEDVCQAKGCWMKLNMPDGEQVMVKFKDYGFFVPKDIKGKEVIVNGIAFVNEMSVDEQQHYAEDGGATPEEIALITEPKKTFGFQADGVLLKE
ncbi:MAG: DUF4920 domain-containing protein [bacterium]